MGITFMTLRARSPALKKEVALLPASAFREVELDVPTRKYRFPKVYEQSVRIAERNLRQLFITNLGHEESTILLTNDSRNAKNVITRYAKRMLIENALSDAVRFFHMNALSSSVGIKVDFDMALLAIASGLYRQLAHRMRDYADAQAGHIFRDPINMPATVTVAASAVTVRFHRRAHLPIIIDSGILDSPVKVPGGTAQPFECSPERVRQFAAQDIKSLGELPSVEIQASSLAGTRYRDETFVLKDGLRVGEHGQEVLAREVRVVFKNLLLAPARGLESKQKLDTDPRALHAWATAACSRIGYDSFAPFHRETSRSVDFRRVLCRRPIRSALSSPSRPRSTPRTAPRRES